VADVVHELLLTEVALDKLGARGISAEDAEQLPRNQHITARNPRAGVGPDSRRLLIRLERLADARGKKPGQVVADLLRDADRSAA
jgi:hypothetical protein